MSPKASIFTSVFTLLFRPLGSNTDDVDAELHQLSGMQVQLREWGGKKNKTLQACLALFIER